MKYPTILLLSLFIFFACKSEDTIDLNEITEEEIKTALIEHFNGDWNFSYSIRDGILQDGNSDISPIPIEEEIWTINGNDLTISRKYEVNHTPITTGKHKISVTENDNGTIFLLIDDEGFGAINLTKNTLSLNTGIKPNESVSHAITYFFGK